MPNTTRLEASAHAPHPLNDSIGRRCMPRIPYARTLLALVTLIAVAALMLHGPIAQDPAYHHFADIRALGALANAGNVLSNLPFLLAGLYGLWRAPRLAEPRTRAAYLTLCIAVFGVGLGSGYYHFAPSTSTLLWDRLPMTVAFMALFSLLLDERVVPGARVPTLRPLVLFGVASALYWYWTEMLGAGDLRAYVLVQFLPIALIPLILALFPARYLQTRWLLAALGLYVLAKLGEHFDGQVFDALHMVSGHSLKHAVAAAAVACLVQAVPVFGRTPLRVATA